MTNYANGDTGSDRAYEYEQAQAEAREEDAYWHERWAQEEAEDANAALLEDEYWARYDEWWADGGDWVEPDEGDEPDVGGHLYWEGY